MPNLYNVKLKIGKRSYSTKMYSSNHTNILTFVKNNLMSEVVSIEQIIYEAPKTTTYNVDDPLTYKGAMYLMVGNDADSKMNQFIFQTVKLTRTVNEVFADMKSLLDLDKSSSIKSLVSANISSR